jgi:hypothetical protein
MNFKIDFEIVMMIVKALWFCGMGCYCYLEPDRNKRVEKILWLIAGTIVIFR